ncbi:adenosinetriphosphatase [Blastomyces dermatitidis ER-3]|uniref:Adenosinetriphosphatase n=2 Tax=Ajellomyces dermatitidis TaxID=5039 RepID=F2TDS7_AJEDA|nr:adenosinetriphosphatase [Blastomyces dermatitidis ER-3]EEQ84528.2 adenosinetriphosphatase [Blastomyces dermatitidis ER-3]EGE81390.2 adenosinetriphosphatase [Blastomyces dermatitidis ATCC 18188]
MANDRPPKGGMPLGLATNKYSTSLRKRGPSQQSRSSLNLSVADSAASESDDSINELLKAPRKRAKVSDHDRTNDNTSRPAVMVAVSIGHKPSFGSPSSSTDAGGTSTTTGDSTPATTANVTPAEPINPIKRRVNATARFQQLRSSAFGLMRGSGGAKGAPNSTSTDASPDESADEALARALQAEEYGDSNLDEPTYSLDSNQTLRPRLNATRLTRGRATQRPLTLASNHVHANMSSAIRSDTIPDSEESSLSELDSDLASPDISDSEIESALSDEDSSDEDSSDGDSARRTTRPLRRVVIAPRHRRVLIRPRNAEEARLTPRALRERRKLEQQHPIIQTMWDDLKSAPLITPTPAAQPSGISRNLKSFQLEGLNWMIQQEKSQWKGGLLGDEMGMGKTIQAVSLLMSDYPVGKPSLVIVPPVALMQWQSEIEQYTDGKLKVLIHHGSNSKVKNLSAKELMAYDVIMISYAGLESMHRKEVKGWKRNDGLVKEDSVIHSIHYHRLILDEAHSIKQRTTSVARACFALKSTYKWCLSGTPVQNRIGEFFSLLRFLEVKPFACYFCKMCPCQELHWSQDAEKRCTHCRHSGFSHVSIFNQEILNPITESRHPADRKAGLEKLRFITDRIMLRRVKQDHTASMELPPKRVILHNEFFGEIERDFSSSIMTNTVRQFDTYVSRGVMLNNYANIFGLIMQMRQVANHPDLILKKHAEGGQNVLVCGICDEPAEEPIRSRCRHEFCRQCAKDYIRSFEDGREPDCPRCHIPLSIDFEQPDIEQEEDQVKKNSIINRIKMENWTSSTKIEMLVYDLFKLRSKKQTHKSIVFSQFTSMLQLVEWRLRRVGFNTVMLDGSMTPAQRQKSIEHFMNNVDVEVFLVSLKAGGVALNLTEASRVFIVDPWWNPAAEWQSADRCHRIGQRRPCVITRLCIEDSVESRMVLLQEKKANMIRGTINKDQSEALEKLTPEDMQFLFRGT